MKAGSHNSHSRSSSRPFTIAVEGNIGAGKSTFLDHFAKVESVQVLPEPVAKWQDMGGQNLLELQYSDPERWSHLVQSYIQVSTCEHCMYLFTLFSKYLQTEGPSIKHLRLCSNSRRGDFFDFHGKPLSWVLHMDPKEP